MALTGMTFRETFEHISERDTAVTEENGATVFICGNLPADLRTHIKDGVAGFQGGDFRMNTQKGHLDAVRYGLRGVRNFLDEDGKAIKFETEAGEVVQFGETYRVVSGKFLNRLPDWLIGELGRAILDANAMSGQERKNSNTQSSQSA